MLKSEYKYQCERCGQKFEEIVSEHGFLFIRFDSEEKNKTMKCSGKIVAIRSENDV